jgi:hypothetical protein
MEAADFCETLVVTTLRTPDLTLNQFQVKRKMYALGIPFRKKER